MIMFLCWETIAETLFELDQSILAGGVKLSLQGYFLKERW